MKSTDMKGVITLLYNAHLNVKYEDFGPDDLANFFGEHMENDSVSYVEQAEVEQIEEDLYRIVFHVGEDVEREDGEGYDIKLYECITYGSLRYDENEEPYYLIQKLNTIRELKEDQEQFDVGSMPGMEEMFPMPGGVNGIFSDMIDAMMGNDGIQALIGNQEPSNLEPIITGLNVTEEETEGEKRRFVVEFDTDEDAIQSDDVAMAISSYFR